jgi:ligand-binding sensor domain-containing protein
MKIVLMALLALPQQAAQWHPPPNVEGLTGAEVRAVTVGSDGSVWLGVRDRGLVRIAGEDVEWIDSSGGLVSDGVVSIHEDRTGRLWVGGAGGVSLLDAGRWAPHRSLGGLEPRVVFDVYEQTSTGSIWVAATGGAARHTPDGWQVLGQADGLPHAVVHAVVMDETDAVWFACRTGLARVEQGDATVFFPEVNFRSAAVAPDGTLWFGTSDGIYTWAGSSWGRHREGQATYPVHVDARGTVWAGSSPGNLVRYRDGRWITVPLPVSLDGAEVFDLASEADGSVWVATSKGAARLDAGH